MPIIIICLAFVIAVLLYWENGRTIYERRTEPSEAEMNTTSEILTFEQQKLSECRELLSRYDDRISELGVEIRPVLSQTRAGII